MIKPCCTKIKAFPVYLGIRSGELSQEVGILSAFLRGWGI